MSWDRVVGHRQPLERLQRIWATGRRAGTWLFVGPEGIGKRTFSLQLAKTLLCEKNQCQPFDSCDDCPGCHQFDGGGHPDLLQVARPADKSSLPVELLIGDRENRRDEGLCRAIAMKSSRGMGKVALINDADDLARGQSESANVLLKTLEEPPPGTTIILLGTSINRQLPTIVSRCQVLRFEPLSESEVVAVLKRVPDFEPKQPLEELARGSGGSIRLAMLLDDPAVSQFRDEWLQRLASLDPAACDTPKTLVKFAEEAGKEGVVRRERLVLVSNIAIGFLNALQLQACGVEERHDPAVSAAAGAALRVRPLDPGWISRCVERTVAFQDHLAANVGLANAVDPWLDDLAALLRGRIPAPFSW